MRGPVTVLFTNRSCRRETSGNFAGEYLAAGGVHARQFREHVKPLFPLIARGTRENIGAIRAFARVSIARECVITYFFFSSQSESLCYARSEEVTQDRGKPWTAKLNLPGSLK